MAEKIFRQMFEEKYMRFPDGKSKAVTFSYDDGVVADKKLLGIFNKYNLKATFNLNSRLFNCENWHGRMDEEQTYSTFCECGQEIALHGARHIFLNKVPLCEAIKEVADNRAYLENKFCRIVNGMAYAYNGFNGDIKRVLSELGVKYARTTFSTRSFALPEDFLEWNPTCHHNDPQLFDLLDKFLNKRPEDEFKFREPWLFYVWGHSYEFDDNDNWDVMERFSREISGRDDVWYAANGQICDYVAAYRSLVYSIDGERVFNPSCMPVWLEIRGEVYKIDAGGTVKFRS